jgi:hypothetical protein
VSQEPRTRSQEPKNEYIRKPRAKERIQKIQKGLQLFGDLFVFFLLYSLFGI